MVSPTVTQPNAESAQRSYADVWVVLPTYNEKENLREIVPAILAQLPGATLLVVDDSSPDGTGQIADEIAAAEPRVQVLHRASKQGLGKAYTAGFERAFKGGAARIVQMDADWSHDPKYLPTLVDGLDSNDVVIGSRYVKGGGVRNWGIGRKIVSRGGSLFSQMVLFLRQHDLTGGFRAWRRATLEALPWGELHSGGYVFQIETAYLASRNGARIREVPIVFVDRRLGASKMSRRIIIEALVVVLRLRFDDLRGRLRRKKPR
jgi:dolichol-phosphate mannosyltransferase